MKKWDKRVKIAIFLVVITVVLFGVNMLVNKKEDIDYTNLFYINVGKEKVPSLYSIIGLKNISDTIYGSDKTGEYVEITYEDVSLNELTIYINSFKDDNYELVSSNKDRAVIVNETDDGKIITIETLYNEDFTKIKYSKGNGILTRN